MSVPEVAQPSLNEGDSKPDYEGDTEYYRSKGNQPIPLEVGEYKTVVMVKHTMARLANDIVNHNRATKFTPVPVVAMPGFGKTTFNHHLVHEIHKLEPSYSIHYYQNTDILRLDTILQSLPKRKPVILVFDDVSYILENLPKNDRIRILDRLTRVREVLDPEYKETPSILIMDYHYSYALPKTFRQSNFKIFISVTDEERENYLKQMGYHNREKIQAYIRIFIAMMRYARFYIQNPNENFNDGRDFVYYRDKPFRPAFVSNYGELHLTLFHKIHGCQICSFKKTFDKPDPDFWVNLVKKYKPARVHKLLRIYAFQMTGHKGLLSKNDRTVYTHIKDHHAENKLDLVALEQLLRAIKKLPKPEQEAYLIQQLTAMEGREISKALVTDASNEVTRKEAKELEKAGSNDTIDLPDPDEEQELEKGIHQLFGDDMEADTDEADDSDFELDEESDDMAHEGDGLAFDPLNQNKEMSGEQPEGGGL